MGRQIEIYIDKIVLEGFGSMNVKELKKAVQEHLTTLILEQGLPDGFSSPTDHGKLKGGQIEVGTNPKADGMGSGIAGGIYQGIRGIKSIP